MTRHEIGMCEKHAVLFYRNTCDICAYEAVREEFCRRIKDLEEEYGRSFLSEDLNNLADESGFTPQQWRAYGWYGAAQRVLTMLEGK